MTHEDKLKTSVALIRRLENKTFLSDYELDGTIILDADTINDLVRLDEHGGVDQVVIGNEPIAGNFADKLPPKINKRVTVRLVLGRLGKIYKTFDIFLNHHDHRILKPNLFYTVTEDTYSLDEQQNDLLKGYSDTISFIDMLAKLSDIPNRIQSGNEIFFSGAIRLEIPAEYTAADIRELSGLKALRENLLITLHHDEKRELFKSTIIDTLSREHNENKLFTTLLARYDILSKKYREAYSVYVKQFSITEITEEIEQNHIDLTNKLHAVMVEMNKSIFVLPIAFIFAATKLKEQPLFCLNNSIILASCWVAIAIFFFSLANHKRTLKFVYDEISRQKKKAEEYPDLVDTLLPPYIDLLNRCSFQTWVRRGIGITLWIIILSLTGLYIHYGNSASNQQEKLLTNEQQITPCDLGLYTAKNPKEPTHHLRIN